MSQFQPPSQPHDPPPFGSAAAFGEQPGLEPDAASGASAPAPAGGTGHHPQDVPGYGRPVPPAPAEPQSFGQPDPYARQAPSPDPYAQYPGQSGHAGHDRYDPYAGGPYAAPGAHPYQSVPRPAGPSLFEDPQRLGRFAWLAVAIFGGLIAVASVLDAIANFAMAGFYGGASTVLTGLAVLLKGLSLAAVVVTVGKLAIDFFVGAALDRRSGTAGTAAGAGADGGAGTTADRG